MGSRTRKVTLITIAEPLHNVEGFSVFEGLINPVMQLVASQSQRALLSYLAP